MAGDQVFIKCAWRLIPFIMVLRLVHVLDRVNVGFAALTMNKDLAFSRRSMALAPGLSSSAIRCFRFPPTSSSNGWARGAGFSASWRRGVRSPHRLP